MQYWWRIAGGVIAISAAACSGALNQPAASATADQSRISAPGTKPAVSGGIDDGDRRQVQVRSQRIQLLLPDARAWRKEVSGSWWRVRHEPTAGVLRLRTWDSLGPSSINSCRKQLRDTGVVLPPPDPNQVVLDEERRLGRVSRVRVRISTRGTPEAGSGRLELVGGGPESGRCIALLFDVEARGPKTGTLLGASLGTMDKVVAHSLRLMAASDRVPSPSAPTGPLQP